MDNKGAFITMTGEDLTPKFTSYEAVVSIFVLLYKLLRFIGQVRFTCHNIYLDKQKFIKYTINSKKNTLYITCLLVKAVDMHFVI